MSPWSFLLRVLLSLSLALNGVTAAAAATHMPLMHEATTQASPAVAAEGNQDMPCHGHHASKANAGHDAPAATPDKTTSKSSPDCCKSGACRCACVHAAQAALTDWPIAASTVERDLSVRPLLLGHAAPALPHLIRPPIG